MAKNVVVLVRQAGLGEVGHDDRDFGVEMFDKFLHTLEGRADRPRTICFYTKGVELTIEGSPVVLALKMLASMGVRILICGSCIEHYGLRDKVAVGEVGGMKDIVNVLMEADHVVTV